MVNWKYSIVGLLLGVFAFFIDKPIKLIFDREYFLLNYEMFAFLGYFLMFVGIVLLVIGLVKD